MVSLPLQTARGGGLAQQAPHGQCWVNCTGIDLGQQQNIDLSTHRRVRGSSTRSGTRRVPLRRCVAALDKGEALDTDLVCIDGVLAVPFHTNSVPVSPGASRRRSSAKDQNSNSATHTPLCVVVVVVVVVVVLISAK